MITDCQVRKLMKLLNQEQTLSLAAAKSGMDEKTARKYRRLKKLPSEVNKERDWRTREDSFQEMWEEVRSKLELNAGLQAKTLFKDLQRRHPGKFQDGQLRTLQRRVKEWRALEGPPKEVFFEQRHEPGELGQSDFTNMNGLGVSIQGQPFDHLLYHFVLTYSNWEWGTVCFSESFESLSMGFQNAAWKLGGVSKAHQTDRLSAAVHQELHPEVFTQRYKSLLAHYGVEGRRIQAAKPNENGDIEQRHYRPSRVLVAQINIVDDGDGFQLVGPSNSVTIGGDGLPLISYWRHGRGMRVAHCDDVVCSSATINDLEASFNHNTHHVITTGQLPVLLNLAPTVGPRDTNGYLLAIGRAFFWFSAETPIEARIVDHLPEAYRHMNEWVPVPSASLNEQDGAKVPSIEEAAE